MRSMCDPSLQDGYVKDRKGQGICPCYRSSKGTSWETWEILLERSPRLKDVKRLLQAGRQNSIHLGKWEA